MPLDQNVPRWIFASISKHFDDNKQTLFLYIEGQPRATDHYRDFIELRVDGPRIVEQSKNYWELSVEINIIITSGMSDLDYHKIYKDVGIVVTAFTNAIPVYKYGADLVDDGTFLGCLALVRGGRTEESVLVRHFGLINPKDPLLQATVEGHYILFLST